MNRVQPDVSVVIPMRDAAGTVAAAIASATDGLVAVEVIVVDDGSTDNGAAVAGAAGARVVAGPRRGIAAAVNAGLDAAAGRYVCRCDADDLLLAGRFARQVAFLDDRPAFVAVGATHLIAEADGTPVTPWPMRPADREVTDELRRGDGPTHLGSYLIRTDVARDLRLREFFETSEDADLLLRLGERGRVFLQSQPTYQYHLHAGGITQRSAAARRRWFADRAAEFQRQRRDTGRDDLQRGRPPTPPPETDGPADVQLADRVGDLLAGRAFDHFRHGERCAARRTAWRAVRRRPTDPNRWRLLASVALRPLPEPPAGR